MIIAYDNGYGYDTGEEKTSCLQQLDDCKNEQETISSIKEKYVAAEENLSEAKTEITKLLQENSRLITNRNEMDAQIQVQTALQLRTLNCKLLFNNFSYA